MKKRIKIRLMWSYLLLIIFTVAVFETIILTALYVYYQDGIKQTLRDQGQAFTSFYEQEIITNQLNEKSQAYLSRYNFLVNAYVQLVDLEGDVIAETGDIKQGNLLKYEDVQMAFKGETGYSSSIINGKKSLTTAVPLVAGGEISGAIRLTTSLEQLHYVFYKNAIILLSIGGFVITLAVLVSLFMAYTITRPVTVITKAAERMAGGEFSVRVNKDIDDEIGKLADTLNYLAQQVQKHEQVKNEFIAAVSHDLRTPLTSIKGWSVTLHTLSEDVFMKEGLEIITNESDRLTTMVSDLLDLSSLTSGKLSYHFTEIAISSLLSEVVQQMKPRAINKGISLVYEPNEYDIEIQADKNRIKQMIVNLLDNALKFTATGGKITIILKRINQAAWIEIRDSGVGIEDSQLELVKEKFVKGKGKGAGTGLGLAICDEIVKAHHGSLALTSERGRGTLVQVCLPIK